MFGLALKLGKTVGEIELLPISEFYEWLAYFSWLSKEE